MTAFSLFKSSTHSPTPKPQDFHCGKVSQSPLSLTELPLERPVTCNLLIRVNVLCPDMVD